jgi:nucleoside diphosphate kinase
MHKGEMAKQRTTMAFDEEDRENIAAIQAHLEKQGLKVSAAEAIRYALRQAVALLGRKK